MFNLIRAEWFTLTRRPLTWVLLFILLILLIGLRSIEFLAVALHDGIFSGGTIRVDMLRDAQIAEFRRQLLFPGIFGTALGHVNSIGGMCAIVLAAGAVGSEYSWGTLRTQLARHPDRRNYLIAKIVTLLAILLVWVVLVLLLGVLLALLFGALLGEPGTLRAEHVFLLPLGALRAIYVLLPYVMVTVACGILGRSVLAGAAGGFLFLFVDVGLGALAFLENLSPLVRFAASLVVQPNINTLVVLNSRSFGLDPALLTRNMDLTTLPSPLHATLVIAVYSALFFVSAYRTFLRRDVTGAA